MIRRLEGKGASGNDELWAETDDNGSESATLWADGNITRRYDELWAVPPEETMIRGKRHPQVAIDRDKCSQMRQWMAIQRNNGCYSWVPTAVDWRGHRSE